MGEYAKLATIGTAFSMSSHPLWWVHGKVLEVVLCLGTGVGSEVVP